MNTGDTCAIKSFNTKRACKREVEILRSLSHVRLSIEIHICTPILTRGQAAIIDCIDHDEALTFMAVKWVEGETLEEQRQKKPFTHREVEMIVHDVLEALAYVHHRGIIHNDIKPPNLLVSVLCSLIYMQSANK